MKVVQINVLNKTRSTGRTTDELDKFLSNNGVDSYVVYGIGPKPKDRTHQYRTVNRIGYLFHNVLAKFFGDQGCYSYFATKRMLKWIDKINPDVIHLRNLYGNCFNIKKIFNYIKKKEIACVITTHDFWLLTGLCAYPRCDKYSSIGCFGCDKFVKDKYNWFFDRSKKLFNIKLILRNIKSLGIQANSFFSKTVVEKSFLKNNKISVIYNWIDFSKFYPEIDEMFYENKENRKIILSIWNSLDESSERFNMLVKVSKLLCKEYLFVTVGNNNIDKKKYPSLRIIQGTNSIQTLRKYYSNADVLFNPSTTDTFGKVVAESLCCGTPAVVFNTQALPELVSNGCGEIVLEYNELSAANAIKNVLSKDKNTYSIACVNRARSMFSLENNCKKLVEMYKELITNEKN